MGTISAPGEDSGETLSDFCGSISKPTVFNVLSLFLMNSKSFVTVCYADLVAHHHLFLPFWSTQETKSSF